MLIDWYVPSTRIHSICKLPLIASFFHFGFLVHTSQIFSFGVASLFSWSKYFLRTIKKMADVESGNMKKSASLQDVLGSKNNLKTNSVFR